MRYLLLLLLIAVSTDVSAQLKLHRILTDNAVIQRDKSLLLHGWSKPNDEVTLLFNAKSFKTVADVNGNWTIKVPAQKAGGPYELKFSTATETVAVKNILFGDVWLCSGQSNMEMMVNNVKDKYADIVAGSTNAYIRHFTVPQRYNFKNEEQDLSGGEWREANPHNVLQFSAVAYFFALELYKKYKVPIGLVNASLGGSPAEAWMSKESLKEFPNLLSEAIKFQDDALIQDIESSDRTRISGWYAEAGKKDIGVKEKWKTPNIDDSLWGSMQLPGYWTDEVSGNGIVWLRRTFEVPSELPRQPARLNLGRVVDQDSVFINGEFVGTTGYQYPQRRYSVKPGVIKAGQNTIAIKVINQSGKGGFVKDKPYELIVGQDTLNLSGAWKYRQSAMMEPLAGQTFIRWKPTGLFNSMIAPITWYPIKGAIWYQGESNVGRHDEYKKLLPTLIRSWRDRWNDNFPFIYVQLPNFLEPHETPGDSYWASFREAQREILKVPGTGMAITIDAGEWNDIHPLDKETVGKRLALNARKIAYGEKIQSSGPLAAMAKFETDAVHIRFDNARGGLQTSDRKALQHIAISADGKRFVWANAIIGNDEIKVWHESIRNPVAVRYAWADNPEGANLSNKEGLPASPFEVRKNNDTPTE